MLENAVVRAVTAEIISFFMVDSSLFSFSLWIGFDFCCTSLPSLIVMTVSGSLPSYGILVIDTAVMAVTVRTAEAVILAFMGICIFFNLYLTVAVARDRQVNIFSNFLSSSRSFFLAENNLDFTVFSEHCIIFAISETDFSS